MLTRYLERFSGAEAVLEFYLNNHAPRLAEVDRLISIVGKDRSLRVLNIPCEGELISELAPSWSIDYADFKVTDFMKRAGVIETTFSLGGITDDHYDAIIGIVPLHHLTDLEQCSFIKNAKDKLRAGGELVMAEPLRGSRIAQFLDVLIHKYSPEGHTGNYPTEAFVGTLKEYGYTKVKLETFDCSLTFDSENHLSMWLKSFFGIAPPSEGTFMSECKDALHCEIDTHQRVTLEWPLSFFSAKT